MENALGCLKGWWRSLLKQMEYYDIQHTTNRIVSCMVIHNIIICEQLGVACRPEWIHTNSEASIAAIGILVTMTTSVGNSNANAIHYALKQYVYENQ